MSSWHVFIYFLGGSSSQIRFRLRSGYAFRMYALTRSVNITHPRSVCFTRFRNDDVVRTRRAYAYLMRKYNASAFSGSVQVGLLRILFRIGFRYVFTTPGNFRISFPVLLGNLFTNQFILLPCIQYPLFRVYTNYPYFYYF